MNCTKAVEVVAEKYASTHCSENMDEQQSSSQRFSRVSRLWVQASRASHPWAPQGLSNPVRPSAGVYTKLTGRHQLSTAVRASQADQGPSACSRCGFRAKAFTVGLRHYVVSGTTTGKHSQIGTTTDFTSSCRDHNRLQPNCAYMQVRILCRCALRSEASLAKSQMVHALNAGKESRWLITLSGANRSPLVLANP